jgi:hypothetical protein
MSFSFVQEAHDFAYLATGNPSITTASPVTKGNLLIAWCTSTTNTGNYIPDDGRNCWVPILLRAPGAGGFGFLCASYCIAEDTRILNPQFVGGAGYVSAPPITMANAACQILEFSGNGAVPFVTSTFATGTSTSPAASVTVAGTTDLIVGIAIPDTTSDSLIETAGWTNAAGVGVNYSAIYAIEAASGTFSPTFAQGLNAAWGCLALAFQIPTATHTISGSLGTGGAGATVLIYNQTTDVLSTVTADGSGNYVSPGLENASYVVQPQSAVGFFTPNNIMNIVVSGANVTGKNFTFTSVNINLSLVVTASDTMIRADENPLSEGGKWTSNGQGDPVLKLVSHEAVETSTTIGSNNSGPFCAIGISQRTDSFPNNQWSQIQIDVLDAVPHAKAMTSVRDGIAQDYYLAVRNNGDGTFWVNAFAFTNTALNETPVPPGNMGKFTWGEQWIGFWSAKNLLAALGDTFGIAVIGTTFYVLHNGSVVGIFSDNTFSSGAIRLLMGSNGAVTHSQLSHFQAGSVSAIGGSGNQPMQNVIFDLDSEGFVIPELQLGTSA